MNNINNDNNDNFNDHQYTLGIQEIKEQVIYLTEVLKGDRNFLNKHFQNAITNYFMEDYASQFLKEKMGLKTYKEVKQVIAKKLEEKQKTDNSGTKYMNLINIYFDEHSKQGTLELYQDYLKQIAFSNDGKHYQQGTSEWTTIAWKKATALFVYHHTFNTHLSSIFEIWNSLYPEDPIVKKKKTKEERDKEKQNNQSKQNEGNYNGQETGVKKAKKTIQKNKTAIDKTPLNKKDLQQWRKNKRQSPRGSDQEENNDYDYSERESTNSGNFKDQPAQYIQNQININKQKKEIDYPQFEQQQQPQHQQNQLVESLDVKDSIHLFKEKIKQQSKDDGFEEFPAFEYFPMSVKNQEHNPAQSIVVSLMDQEKLKEEYQNCGFLSAMDLEQSKERDIFKSLIFAKDYNQFQHEKIQPQAENNQNQNENNLNTNQKNQIQNPNQNDKNANQNDRIQNQLEKNQNQNQPQQNQSTGNNLLQPVSLDNEDFFARNMNIFQDIGFGDFNNEMSMFESQKNPNLKINLPVFNSLTFSAMNINNNANAAAHFNMFNNNNLTGTFQQQNIFGSRKLFNIIQEEQQLTNSLQFLRISDKEEQKYPQNQSIQFDQEKDQNRLLYDLPHTQETVFDSNKLKILQKDNGEDNQNDEGIREIKEFLNQINSLPGIVNSQKC